MSFVAAINNEVKVIDLMGDKCATIKYTVSECCCKEQG
jgi:hypothetical protein